MATDGTVEADSTRLNLVSKSHFFQQKKNDITTANNTKKCIVDMLKNLCVIYI